MFVLYDCEFTSVFKGYLERVNIGKLIENEIQAQIIYTKSLGNP